jgi:hypothetical protein
MNTRWSSYGWDALTGAIRPTDQIGQREHPGGVDHHGAATSPDDLAQVAHEQQMLEVSGDGGQVLQRVDGVLAAPGIA